ncbi:hypothetical protein [uncultured Dysosmobacter sp.]|uniref:hypothetical protein n=1 Tax=uncultured Dysosmobacter sp. TaxID=2591384 RepID=UPI00262B1E10|nr:hypothetical protein [uncultured Dysosmobacter sp.]
MVLDICPVSNYYHGKEDLCLRKAPALPNSAEPGPLTNTLTNISKSAGGHSGQCGSFGFQKVGAKVLETNEY